MIKKRDVIILSIILVLISITATLYIQKTIFDEESYYDKYIELREEIDGKEILDEQEAKIQEEISNKYFGAFSVENIIKQNYYKDTDEVDFSEGAIRGVVSQLKDPYSYYFSPDEMDLLEESLTGDYVGIGVVVSPTEDGYITVVSPYEGYPGDKAGLEPLDKIVAVNGVEVYADDLQYAVNQMRGEEGTDVTATIKRGDEVFDVTFTREKIELETVYSELLQDNIGYIRISQFAVKTGGEFRTHYEKLIKEDIDGLILDLRSNPGGELNAIVDVADMLLGKQIVLTMENKYGAISKYESDGEEEFGKPIVVIVNEGSASAAEALTAAIRDTESGIVVGKETFGKGVAQSVIPLANGGALNLTTAEYFTPNGTNLNDNGVVPDVEVEIDFETEEDEQYDKALEEIKKLIK